MARDYAAAHGVAIGEAIRRISLERAASRLQARLMQNERINFAGLYVEHQPRFRVIARFLRNPSETLSRERAGLGLDADTEATSADISLADLEAQNTIIVQLLTDLNIDFLTSINVRDSSILVLVRDRSAFDQIVSSGAIEPETLLIGGSSGTSCTMGFVVFQNVTNSKGVSTAGHCNNSQTMQGQPLTLITELNDGKYDIQWHAGPPGSTYSPSVDLRNGTFQAIRYFQPTSNIVGGQTVCISGMTSGYRCGTILAVNVTTTAITNGIWVAAPIGGDLSGVGDSGAPWFAGQIAYGIHIGAPGSAPTDAIFMPVERMSVFGLSILAAP